MSKWRNMTNETVSVRLRGTGNARFGSLKGGEEDNLDLDMDNPRNKALIAQGVLHGGEGSAEKAAASLTGDKPARKGAR